MTQVAKTNSLKLWEMSRYGRTKKHTAIYERRREKQIAK